MLKYELVRNFFVTRQIIFRWKSGKTKPKAEGNYWHFVDGLVTLWKNNEDKKRDTKMEETRICSKCNEKFLVTMILYPANIDDKR